MVSNDKKVIRQSLLSIDNINLLKYYKHVTHHTLRIKRVIKMTIVQKTSNNKI